MPKKTDNLAPILATLDAYSQRALSTHSHVLMKLIGAQVAPSRIMLKTADKIRAIRWITWARRHDVPLSFIVDSAFEWGRGVSKKSTQNQR